MADRLKILVVSDVFPYPLHDGNRLSIYHFLRVLARRVDYTLLACRPEATGRDLGPETEALTEAFEEGRRRLAGHGIAVETAAPPVGGRAARALACLAAGRPWVNRFFSPTLAALVAERLARGGWDVVQAESILGAQHLPRDFGRRGGAPARHGPPSVLIARDCLSLRHWRAFRRGGAPRELLGWAKIRWMERALFRRFDRIMAIAEVDRHAMARLAAGRPVGLLPNGVDCAALRPDPAREEPDTVAFTGAMDYPPNVDAAVFFVRQIWPAVRRRRPGARLLIIGRDPTEAVRRLGDDSSITVTGTVTSVAESALRAAVIVAPMRWGTGVKTKVLEAAALGKAMVVTGEALAGLALEPGREVLRADEPPEFAAAVAELLENSARRHDLGLAARRRVEADYSWEAMAERLYACYRELTSGRGRHDGVD